MLLSQYISLILHVTSYQFEGSYIVGNIFRFTVDIKKKVQAKPHTHTLLYPKLYSDNNKWKKKWFNLLFSFIFVLNTFLFYRLWCGASIQSLLWWCYLYVASHPIRRDKYDRCRWKSNAYDSIRSNQTTTVSSKPNVSVRNMRFRF